jgi:hypothetical protein
MTRISLGTVLVAVLFFAAYTAWFHLAPGSARAEVVGDDPRILVWQQRYAGMDALVSGTLRYDEDTKCLVLEDDYDGSRWGIVWPKGTRSVIEDGKRGARVGGFLGRVGGVAALAGDRVELGGGGAEGLAGDAMADSGCGYDVVWRVQGSVEVVNPSSGAGAVTEP